MAAVAGAVDDATKGLLAGVDFNHRNTLLSSISLLSPCRRYSSMSSSVAWLKLAGFENSQKAGRSAALQ